MSYAVKVPGMHAIFFLMDLPEGQEGLDIEEDAWVEVPMNVNLWPEGARRPETVLCQSRDDHKHYKLFKYRNEIEGTEWEETGLNFGGTFSKDSWKEFAQRLGAIRALHAIPDDHDGKDA
jgi:hypothetical protein